MNVSDGIAASQFRLEDAVAVGILAFGVAEAAHLATSKVHGFHQQDEVFGFSTIGADVLHGTGSHFAWDNRQVLESEPSLANGQFHPVVPYHTCPHAHAHLFIVVLRDMEVEDAAVEHRSVEVLQEQQVRAASDME